MNRSGSMDSCTEVQRNTGLDMPKWYMTRSEAEGHILF